MTKHYFISGIWKNDEGIITHYAVHTASYTTANGYSINQAQKMSKSAAVALANIGTNNFKTMLWNYTTATWKIGTDIQVVSGTPDFLRTKHDSTVKDNLLHLINYAFVF